MSTTKPTRGERNNNPGNIDYRASDKWQGLDSPPIEQGVSRPRFARFTSPVWGIRAIARLLITYKDKYNLTCVSDIIKRWAPDVENDTDSYISAVAARLGVGPYDTIDVTDYNTMKVLVAAIIKHENGRCIYDAMTFDEALRRAGVVPKRRDVIKKTTFSVEGVGAGGAGIGTIGAGLTETATQMQLVTPESSMVMQIVCAVIALAGVAVTIWALVKRTKTQSEEGQ